MTESPAEPAQTDEVVAESPATGEPEPQTPETARPKPKTPARRRSKPRVVKSAEPEPAEPEPAEPEPTEPETAEPEPTEPETAEPETAEPESAAAPCEPAAAFDLSAPELYLNRELTWLYFNQRVLNEATDDQVPLLERVFFVAVVGSNLDEFFMKRIGGLKQQVGAGVKKLTIDGMLPQEQIDACYKVAQDILVEQRRIEGILRDLLAKEDIHFRRYEELTATQKKEMDGYFKREIYPLLTPQGIDPAHPFPFLSNLSLNLLVSTSEPASDHEFLNRIKVPLGVGVPRFIPVGRKNIYVTFEDLIANNLQEIFPGLVIIGDAAKARSLHRTIQQDRTLAPIARSILYP